MNKGLDALEKMKNKHFVDGRLPLIDRVRFEIIEKEIKDKEKLDKFVEIIKNHCYILQKGVLPQYEQDLLNEVLR